MKVMIYVVEEVSTGKSLMLKECFYAERQFVRYSYPTCDPRGSLVLNCCDGSVE